MSVCATETRGSASLLDSTATDVTRSHQRDEANAQQNGRARFGNALYGNEPLEHPVRAQ